MQQLLLICITSNLTQSNLPSQHLRTSFCIPGMQTTRFPAAYLWLLSSILAYMDHYYYHDWHIWIITIINLRCGRHLPGVKDVLYCINIKLMWSLEIGWLNFAMNFQCCSGLIILILDEATQHNCDNIDSSNPRAIRRHYCKQTSNYSNHKLQERICIINWFQN